MPRPRRSPRPCSRCPRSSSVLRRGLCGACYQRERRGSPAGEVGASCVACGLDDVRLLRSVQLGAELVVACHNHAWLGERTRPRPSTVAGFVELCGVGGDRRRGERRRRAEAVPDCRRQKAAGGPGLAKARAVVEEPSEGLRAVLERWAG